MWMIFYLPYSSFLLHNVVTTQREEREERKRLAAAERERKRMEARKRAEQEADAKKLQIEREAEEKRLHEQAGAKKREEEETKKRREEREKKRILEVSFPPSDCSLANRFYPNNLLLLLIDRRKDELPKLPPSWSAKNEIRLLLNVVRKKKGVVPKRRKRRQLPSWSAKSLRRLLRRNAGRKRRSKRWMICARSHERCKKRLVFCCVLEHDSFSISMTT
jgi:hypothetical protein